MEAHGRSRAWRQSSRDHAGGRRPAGYKSYAGCDVPRASHLRPAGPPEAVAPAAGQATGADADSAGLLHIAERPQPDYRNAGTGGALLDYAEAEARKAGYSRMSLSTHTSNPVRRLYERHGFRVVETKKDAAYERFTGIEGRHLKVKELEEDPEPAT